MAQDTEGIIGWEECTAVVCMEVECMEAECTGEECMEEACMEVCTEMAKEDSLRK